MKPKRTLLLLAALALLSAQAFEEPLVESAVREGTIVAHGWRRQIEVGVTLARRERAVGREAIEWKGAPCDTSSVVRWHVTRTERTAGRNTAPTWPRITLAPGEAELGRESSRGSPCRST